MVFLFDICSQSWFFVWFLSNFEFAVVDNLLMDLKSIHNIWLPKSRNYWLLLYMVMQYCSVQQEIKRFTDWRDILKNHGVVYQSVRNWNVLYRTTTFSYAGKFAWCSPEWVYASRIHDGMWLNLSPYRHDTRTCSSSCPANSTLTTRRVTLIAYRLISLPPFLSAPVWSSPENYQIFPTACRIVSFHSERHYWILVSEPAVTKKARSFGTGNKLTMYKVGMSKTDGKSEAVPVFLQVNPGQSDRRTIKSLADLPPGFCFWMAQDCGSGS